MASTKPRVRVGVVIFLVLSMLACPLAMNGFAARSDAYAQIDFTPNIATLSITQTAVPMTIGPLVWAPGMRFDCPVGMPERCRPDIVAVHGDDRFGWGEMVGYPGLVLVWITDETGTHYMVVSADDPQLTGLAGGDSFMELMELRIERANYTGERVAEGVGSGATAGVIVIGLLAACPETAGVTCLIAGLTAGAAGVGNVIRNAILSSQAEARIRELEQGLAGRFRQMELNIVGP
jgi:hypothetical protein